MDLVDYKENVFFPTGFVFTKGCFPINCNVIIHIEVTSGREKDLEFLF